uniref:Protein containing Urb2 domain n=1 Tax=Rhipicephalus zambeziensis TaxID=60191 RepID=A0A224YYN3_9ACAR
MALANTLLFELTNNSVSRSIELVQLALRSPVYIPQKREIIVSWICRTVEDRQRSELTSDDAGTLWNILLSLVSDMQPLEVAMVVQDSFLQAIQKELEQLTKTDYAECLLETMTALIQKAPQSTLVLKLPAVVALLSVTLKQCRLCTKKAELLDQLCLTASALMEVVLAPWYQNPCSTKEAFGHLKPLLGNMMYILHFKKAEASEAVQKVHKTIKKFVHVCFFQRSNINTWLTALYEYLRMDGWNAVVPFSKEQLGEFKKRKRKGEEDEPEDEPEDGDVKVDEKMMEVLQAEPHRQQAARKEDEYLLEQLMEFLSVILKDEEVSSKTPPANYLPEFFAVFLEGLITRNKTEDLQSNTVLLAYFAYHLGVKCATFSGTVPMNMALSQEQQLYYLKKLLEVYQATEQYCLVVVMPQFKRSLFKPRRWFGELAAKLQSLEYNSAAWFQCLGTIMRIAPNLVEGSMIKTLEKCWEVCGQNQPGLIKARNLLLESILATYTELFRVPKLLRNIFSSFTHLSTPLAQTSIPVSFLHKFAECCINLPPGQLTDTWQFLVDQLGYWTTENTEGNMSEGGVPEKKENHLPKILVVTEIFRTFAHHIQVVNPTTPPLYVTKICELMLATCALATQMLDASIEKKSKQRARCALSVFHLWGELHLVLCLYRRSYGEAYTAPELTAPLEATDLSFLHPSLTADKLESLLDMMKTDQTKLICHHLMLLWIQKIRALVLFTEVTNEHLEASLQATAKLVFSHVNMTVSTSVWSQRVCEISESRFPVASLHTLLINFPLLSPYLPAKNVTALCQFFLEVMAHTNAKDVVDSKKNALSQKEIVTTYLGSQAFIECKLAQTCYVTALWGHVSTMFKARKRKLDSEEEPRGLCQALMDTLSGPVKWEKYAETVPQADYSSKQLLSSEGLNKMWTAIHAASEKLAAIIATSSENFSERISVADVVFLLEALDHLPLGSLFPGNQLRCMLGLLAVIFLLEGTAESKSGPLWEKSLAAVKSAVGTFCALLQSPRRSWLLDFVSGGALISRLVAAFQGNLCQALEDESMLQLYEGILDALVRQALRKKNTVRMLNSVVKEVKEVISSAEDPLSKAHTSAALVLFKGLVLELRRKPHEDVKSYIQKMAHTMSEGAESWLRRLLGCTKPSAEIRRHIYTIGLLQAQYTFCSHRLSTDGEVSDSSCSKDTLAALSMATAELQQSEASEVADTLVEVMARIAHYRSRSPELLSAPFSALGKGIYTQLALRAAAEPVEAASGTVSLTLENCISDKHYKFMETFFQACTLAELKDILGELVSTLMKDSVQSVPMKVHLQVLQLVCSCVDNQKQDGTAKDIMSIIHKIIEYFAVILSLYEIADHPELVVYVLKFFSTLLTMRKVVLSHRGGVVILQSLSSLNLLHLWSRSQEHFCQSVMAASRLLSIFLSKRIVMVVGCTVAYQSCVSHLLKSIIKVGGSEQLKSDPVMAYQVHMCALSLERLVGEIASHKKEFSKTGGFLIADYILESINTVLHPPIKKTLQFLVYKLFELADEHRRAMVHATLPKEGTEVFKTLFADSKRLRFKGKV